ncbi:MAG: YaeQ family protein [Burkholderiales bacterium]
MALKATIFKAQLQIADMDRHVYMDHPVTLARHPSETDERMMIRLLALALNLRADANQGQLEMAKGMWEPDEPDLWEKDLTGQIKHWIDVGQPDDKRLLKACPRADKVSVYSFSHSTPVWWKGLETKITRAENLNVWQIPADQSQALAGLAQRGMQLQVTVQDGQVWLGDGQTSVEIQTVALRRSVS